MFQIKVLRNTEKHILYSVSIFFKNHAFYEIKVEKYGKAGLATDNNKMHAHSMLHNRGYKQTLGMCAMLWFFYATIVLGRT
jgi:hypothetical protein